MLAELLGERSEGLFELEGLLRGMSGGVSGGVMGWLILFW